MRMIHNLVAFCGPQPISGGIDLFFNRFKSFAQENACPITMVSLKPARSRGYVTLDKAITLLQKTGADSTTSLEAYSLPNGSSSMMIDYSLALCYSHEKPSCLSISGFMDILPLNGEVLTGLVRLAIETFKPQYGYGCSLAPEISPVLYSMGITLYDINHKIVESGSPEHLQQLTLARWGNPGISERIWEAGIIRDVHPWNFLAAPQLLAPVNGQTLESWIRSGNGTRGTLLALITPEMAFWEVAPEHIPAIKEVLVEFGIVFTLERHLYYKRLKGAIVCRQSR